MGGWDAPWHWIVLAVVVIALVGYKKLPDAARSVGRSLRIFKTEIKGMGEDDKARAKAGEEAEQKALPQAEVVKHDAMPEPPREAAESRPRPRPSPNGQSRTSARSD